MIPSGTQIENGNLELCYYEMEAHALLVGINTLKWKSTSAPAFSECLLLRINFHTVPFPRN